MQPLNRKYFIISFGSHVIRTVGEVKRRQALFNRTKCDKIHHLVHVLLFSISLSFSLVRFLHSFFFETLIRRNGSPFGNHTGFNVDSTAMSFVIFHSRKNRKLVPRILSIKYMPAYQRKQI